MELIKSCNKLIIQGMKRTLFLEEVQIHVLPFVEWTLNTRKRYSNSPNNNKNSFWFSSSNFEHVQVCSVKRYLVLTIIATIIVETREETLVKETVIAITT